MEELTRLFDQFGGVVAKGTADIKSKNQILRTNHSLFPDAEANLDSLWHFANFELENSYHLLNSRNNAKLGHEKGSHLSDYASVARSTYRLMWFVVFITILFDHFSNEPERSMSSCLKKAYDEVLGPHHSFFIRAAVKTALLMSPSRATVTGHVWGKECEIPEEERMERIQNLVQKSKEMMKPWWDWYKEHDLMEIP